MWKIKKNSSMCRQNLPKLPPKMNKSSSKIDVNSSTSVLLTYTQALKNCYLRSILYSTVLPWSFYPFMARKCLLRNIWIAEVLKWLVWVDALRNNYLAPLLAGLGAQRRKKLTSRLLPPFPLDGAFVKRVSRSAYCRGPFVRHPINKISAHRISDRQFTLSCWRKM